MKKKVKHTIGWREWVRLSEFGGVRLKAKVDSGARTSSLHAYNVEIITSRGQDKVRFALYPNQGNKRDKQVVEAPLVDYRSVRSSSGHKETRPVILTTVKLFGEVWPVEITLTNRDIMGFRMLLGRQAVRNRFLIDVSQSFLAMKAKAKQESKK